MTVLLRLTGSGLKSRQKFRQRLYVVMRKHRQAGGGEQAAAATYS